MRLTLPTRCLRVWAAGALACALTGVAPAQAPPRQLSLVPDGKMELTRAGGARDVVFAIGPGGHAVLAPHYGGNIVAFDSSGTALPWKVAVGRGDKAEVMWVTRLGWVAGTPTVWVGDPAYKQVALVDEKGDVTKSIEFASWIHPSWAERRKYPVFASMDPLAVYADQTMLVLPGRERSLISTPGYDHSVAHLLRTTWNGAIQRTVATIPLAAANIDLRAPNGIGHVLNIPYAARTYWAVSSDGLRIVVATPGVTLADSGTIRVTALSDRGDTVFSRQYRDPAPRVPQEAVDKFLAGIQAVGSISVERMRDSAAKQIPIFQNYLTGVMVGHDHATWVMLRARSDTSKERRAMVIDARGDLVGLATIPPEYAPAAASADHLWTFELGRMRTPIGIARFSVRTTGAPPAGTARAATSSTPSRPPR